MNRAQLAHILDLIFQGTTWRAWEWPGPIWSEPVRFLSGSPNRSSVTPGCLRRLTTTNATALGKS